MKTIAIAAMLGAIVAIPYVFGCKKPELIPVTKRQQMAPDDQNVRYDVNDFVV